jgi:hypothetical protein
MTSWKSALGFGAMALFVVGMTPACASAPDDSGDDQSADELGASCGGFANIQCSKPGYRCDITDKFPDASGRCRKECGGIAGLSCHSGYACALDDPKVADSMGVCRAAGQPSCGKAALTTTCAQGYQYDLTKCACEPIHPSWYACAKDSDCKATPRVGCCPNGFNEAVNKNHVQDYESSFVCTTKQMCPLFMILDTRQAECNSGSCQMVAIDKIACGGFTMNPHSCPTGFDCHLPANIPDAPGKCEAKPQCVQNIMCMRTSHWDKNQCACVANPSCGGFAGLACPSGYASCIDNPSDGCDPAKGGADCPGVCVP